MHHGLNVIQTGLMICYVFDKSAFTGDDQNNVIDLMSLDSCFHLNRSGMDLCNGFTKDCNKLEAFTNT